MAELIGIKCNWAWILGADIRHNTHQMLVIRNTGQYYAHHIGSFGQFLETAIIHAAAAAIKQGIH